MNPNLTVSYMSAQVKRQEVERKAARGWLAEQAAAGGGGRQVDVTGTLKRVLATISDGPRRLFREAAGMDVPAKAASPQLDRVG